MKLLGIALYARVSTFQSWEIRKAIEQAGEQQQYFALDFYCSFALHMRKSRAGAKRILGRFDRAYPILCRGEETSTPARKGARSLELPSMTKQLASCVRRSPRRIKKVSAGFDSIHHPLVCANAFTVTK